MRALAALLLLSAPAAAITAGFGDVLRLEPGSIVFLTPQGSLLRVTSSKRTRFACAKKSIKGAPRRVDPRCPVADFLYDPQTMGAVLVEMRARGKAEKRPILAAAGELATTDVLSGGLSVRFAGAGVTLPFKVTEASRLSKPLEELNVGDQVELRSLDLTTVDELKVVPPAP